jgi:hypothetical protein
MKTAIYSKSGWVCERHNPEPGTRRLSEFFENPLNRLAVNCGRAFRPDDKLGAGDFLFDGQLRGGAFRPG